MGRQINDEFWCEAQRTARYYAWKSMECGLTNFELCAYSKLCSLLEKMYNKGLKDLDDSGDSESPA